MDGSAACRHTGHRVGFLSTWRCLMPLLSSFGRITVPAGPFMWLWCRLTKDEMCTQHQPLLLIVSRTMCRLRRKRVRQRSRLLFLSLSLHSQLARSFGRTIAVPVKLAVVAVALVRAAIAQLYSAPLTHLAKSLLSSMGSLNT